jgi:lipid-A-disaccharide synthase
MTNIIIVSGEPSGDRHAASLILELKEQREGLFFYGMGGSASRSAGMQCWVDIQGLSVIGVFEVLTHYRKIRAAFATLTQRIKISKPDLLILVDYVEFNLRLAKHAKSLGIRVLFYISPQVWAWRRGRAKKIRSAIDAMAVLFPFEEEFYKRAGIPVRYVGNPLVDDFDATGGKKYWFPLRDRLTSPPYCVGLFPGSRDGEISQHLKLILKVSISLKCQVPNIRLMLSLAPNLTQEMMIRSECEKLGIEVVLGNARQVLSKSHVVLSSSGTATLEAGLHVVPMVVIYKMASLTYFFLRRLLLIPDIALVNIVCGSRVVPEFIQEQASVGPVTDEILKILFDLSYRANMITTLKTIRDRLGPPGVSSRVAEMSLELIDHGRITEA